MFFFFFLSIGLGFGLLWVSLVRMWVFGLISWLLNLGFGDIAGGECHMFGCVCGVYCYSNDHTLLMSRVFYCGRSKGGERGRVVHDCRCGAMGDFVGVLCLLWWFAWWPWRFIGLGIFVLGCCAFCDGLCLNGGRRWRQRVDLIR